MKRLSRFFALLICCAALMLTCATTVFAADSGSMLRYIPTEITVTAQKTTVKGYFVNMNDGAAISNLTDCTVAVCIEGNQILKDSFGTLNAFTVQPKSMVYYEFEYKSDGTLNNGSYVCDDTFYAMVDCTYTETR